MNASIVIIGDEILLGRVADTNSGTIARVLTAAGFDVAGVRTVGDNGTAIAGAVEAAIAEADLVLTTGGLGPTRDDITKTVMMNIFGGTLKLNPAVLANVERIFADRGLDMNNLTRTQAMVPDSCRVIQNRFGTAPLMWFEKGGKVLVAMPGVPFETRGMLPEVMDAVTARFHAQGHFRRAELTVAGISESALAEELASLEDALPTGTHIAYLPSPARIVLRLDALNLPEDTFNSLMDTLRAKVQPWYAGEGDLSAAQITLGRLLRAGYTLATAESCTGGNIAHTVTAIAGASDVFLGGIVSYANEVKTNVLGVPADVLAAHGAVSEPVVRAMAEGARRVCGASCAVATSGIAGPGGGTPDKPVGTVWIAASTPATTVAKLFHISGDRAAVIDGATARALHLLDSILPEK